MAAVLLYVHATKLNAEIAYMRSEAWANRDGNHVIDDNTALMPSCERRRFDAPRMLVEAGALSFLLTFVWRHSQNQ